MLKEFVKNIEQKQLFGTQQKILLAVSGGADSMVLLHLFREAGFNYGVVHCNFNLRGSESDGDEHFVREIVAEQGVPTFFQSFETKEYAELNGVSIEMAARELRYEYFERIRKENGFDYIATAHHQDDMMETFFLNLSRKTGIKGLTGIREKTGYVIRPLLFAGRKDIQNYARKHYVDYREDSSNNEVVYQRNFVRHKILPLFEELNPSFKKNFMASLDNLKAAEKVYLSCMEEAKNAVVQKNNDDLEIDILELQNSDHPETLLLEILSEFHFNPTVVTEVFESLNAESGKCFYSKTHRLIKDRQKLFVSELKDEENRKYYLEENATELEVPVKLIVEKIDADDFQLIRKNEVGSIDLDKVDFPLMIRKWKQGDYFQPLGMTGFKKVSDFFIDQKLPLHEKENTWLLCRGKQIVWIIGRRLDNRFKVTATTRRILQITKA